MSETVNCAIYARYSTNIQREASIEDQVRKCREIAKGKGWQILDEHIYADKARSGAATNNRDAFKELMRNSMSGNCPFQRILVDDTSRIARNTREALEVFSILTYYGIHVYYAAQNIDTAHETAEEMITINGLIDSLYIRNLAKETHRGIEGQVLKGYSAGGKRYGYRSVPVLNGKVDIYGNPEADGYVLNINPDEADIVIKIFSLFGEQGYSAKKIVNILNMELIEAGSPKPPRNKYWSVGTLLGNKKSFHGILNNEIYIGKYYWNRLASKRNPENGRKRVFTKSSENWIILPKPDLQIISQELWNKVKARQRQARKAASGMCCRAKLTYSRNLASGISFCSECGGNIVVVSGGKYSKYGCSNNWNKGSSVCKASNRIEKENLERAIVDSLQLSFTDDQTISYLQNKVESFVHQAISIKRQRFNDTILNDQLRRVEREISNLVKAISAGIISETVNTTLLEAEQKRKITKQLIAERSEESDSMHVARDLIKSYVADLPLTLNKNPMLGKFFLSTVLDAVIIEPSETSWIIKLLQMKHPHGNGECRSVSHKDILSNEPIAAPTLLLKS